MTLPDSHSSSCSAQSDAAVAPGQVPPYTLLNSPRSAFPWWGP
jgi:hypothetical protein